MAKENRNPLRLSQLAFGLYLAAAVLLISETQKNDLQTAGFTVFAIALGTHFASLLNERRR